MQSKGSSAIDFRHPSIVPTGRIRRPWNVLQYLPHVLMPKSHLWSTEAGLHFRCGCQKIGA